MKTMLIILEISLLWLISFVLFAFPTANAMRMPEAARFCSETPDFDFCSRYILNDIRLVLAKDFFDIYLISLSYARGEAFSGIRRLNEVKAQYKSPQDKHRINVCFKQYKSAATSFTKARVLAKKKSILAKDLAALSQLNQDGFEAVRACDVQWSKSGPKQQSPLSFWYINIEKHVQILRVVMRKLYA